MVIDIEENLGCLSPNGINLCQLLLRLQTNLSSLLFFSRLDHFKFVSLVASFKMVYCTKSEFYGHIVNLAS